MLLNLEKMRINNISEKLLREKEKQKTFSLMDQDALNKVFDKHVVSLPIKYNFLASGLLRGVRKYTIEQLNSIYHSNYLSLYEIFDDAAIIHYAAPLKPWKKGYVPLGDLWRFLYLEMYKNIFHKNVSEIDDSYIESIMISPDKIILDQSQMIQHFKEIESSYSYRIGKVVTLIPRKCKTTILMIKTYGFKKTFEFLKSKLNKK